MAMFRAILVKISMDLTFMVELTIVFIAKLTKTSMFLVKPTVAGMVMFRPTSSIKLSVPEIVHGGVLSMLLFFQQLGVKKKTSYMHRPPLIKRQPLSSLLLDFFSLNKKITFCSRIILTRKALAGSIFRPPKVS